MPKLIIGLGNPGDTHENNRHNIGFMVVSSFVHDQNDDFKLWGTPKNSEIAQLNVGGEKVICQKPITYMNLSGEAAVQAATFYKVLPEDVCVIHDELDIPFGEVRLKVGGGDGGHNGLKSITKMLGTSDYARVRMGIGRPPHPQMDVADFVLGNFSDKEFEVVDGMIDLGIKGINAFIGGTEKFNREMNHLNQRNQKKGDA